MKENNCLVCVEVCGILPNPSLANAPTYLLSYQQVVTSKYSNIRGETLKRRSGDLSIKHKKGT